MVSVSAVGSLKNLTGKFVIIDQFNDRTFTKIKLDDEIVAHVSMAHPTSKGLMNACEEAIKENIEYQEEELTSRWKDHNFQH